MCVEARERSTNCTESQLRCAAVINILVERIILIDKGNTHAVCPVFDELEEWEHVVLCDKMKDKRDAWVKGRE